MNPLLPALAVLFWGLASGVWPVAGGHALLVALPAIAGLRWPQNAALTRRAAALTLLALLGLVIYALGFGRLPLSLFQALRWLPLALTPLLLIQLCTVGERLHWRGRALDLRPIFVLAALVAAASANPRAAWFFPIAALLLAALVWPLRRRGTGAARWLAAIALSVGGAYGLQAGLVQLQSQLEDGVIAWLADMAIDTQAERASTRIGTLGRLKRSGRIVLRVQPEPTRGPLLLMEAAYDRYAASAWIHTDPQRRALRPVDGRWLLDGAPAGTPADRIEARVRDGRGVLPLPLGTSVIEQLEVDEAEWSANSAVTVRGAPRVLRFRARRGAGATPPPRAADLDVPPSLREAVDLTWTQIGLAAETAPADRAEALKRHFARGFRYTLDLGAGGGESRDLRSFLLTDRAGHCEYFASASVMLLRRAGIPARYAVGYAAHEPDGRGGFVVRAHDAHAWALAWIDGRWQEVDATPPDWAALENAAAPAWRGLLDRLATLHFAALRAWQDLEPRTLGRALLLAALLLTLPIVPRLWRRLRRGARRAPASSAVALPAAGALQPLAQLLAQQVPPASGETLGRWIERALQHPRIVAHDELRAVAQIAYALRYDPLADHAALDPRLRATAQAWIAAQRAG